MTHDQDTLANVIATAELIARNGTPGELVNYLLELDPDTFVALFVATITADDLDATLEPEDLEKLQRLAAKIGTLH